MCCLGLMAEIRVEVDAGRALGQLDAMLAAVKAAGPEASLKGAEKVRDHARELIDSGAHPPGTRALRPAPGAPGTRTGKLASSIKAQRDVGGGAKVGPTRMASSKNGPYGRFLELGGTHAGHMRWVEDGETHTATVLRKLGRPYMKPARDESTAEIHEITAREIRDAIRMALRG